MTTDATALTQPPAAAPIQTHALVAQPTPLPGPLGAAATQPAFSAGPLWGALVLAALAALAFILSRKRRRFDRRMEVVESLGLGPKRSLCLARIDENYFVLGVSEAGVQLISSVEATAQAGQARQAVARPQDTSHSDVAAGHEVLGFEQLLVESTAEQELRARLAAAGRAVAP